MQFRKFAGAAVTAAACLVMAAGCGGPPPSGYNAGARGTAAAETPKVPGMDEATRKAMAAFMKPLPDGARIAVVNISSPDAATASVVLDEVQYNFYSANRFQMVERNELDAIRQEQGLQMSGEVSDETIVAIGNLVGASIVVTGGITSVEGKKRLNLKALDVKTGRILAMAREYF
jgi:hypothetical protein